MKQLRAPLKRVLTGSVLVIVLGVLTGCGSSRTSVEGYTDADLNDRRIFVLHPAQDELNIVDKHAFSWSRGIGDIAAPERLDTELRTLLIEEMDATYDSNLVFDYGAHTVGAIYPLDVSRDFGQDLSALDWNRLSRPYAEHAVDYLLVLTSVRVVTELPEEGKLRGDETTTIGFALLDPSRENIMIQGNISVETDNPRTMREHYRKIAEELATKLPFFVRDQ